MDNVFELNAIRGNSFEPTNGFFVDKFEPDYNSDNTFEPMGSFNGQVFEPTLLDDEDYSNFLFNKEKRLAKRKARKEKRIARKQAKIEKINAKIGVGSSESEVPSNTTESSPVNTSIASDITSLQTTPDAYKSKNKKIIIGVSVGAGVLALAGLAFFLIKRK